MQLLHDTKEALTAVRGKVEAGKSCCDELSSSLQREAKRRSCDMIRPMKICAFCGNPGGNVEHIIAQWLIERMEAKDYPIVVAHRKEDNLRSRPAHGQSEASA